jgi:catechol 2,3-dioxygenase-like lactoylglutathione lyase family enzyme
MLTNAPVAPTLPAVDLARARKFYEGVLGLRVSRATKDTVWYDSGNGTNLLLYARGATKADHTAAGFLVDDVEKTVSDLRKRGVIFEEYDLPGMKTVDGIAIVDDQKSAWFKDTEGNILAVAESLS